MEESALQLRILERCLASLRDLPTSLRDALSYFGKQYPGVDLSVEQIVDHACSSNANDPIKLALHRAFMHWDHLNHAPWAPSTEANSTSRREETYRNLALSVEAAKALDTSIPVYIAEHVTVIAESHKLWYGNDRALQEFFWPAYRKYLAEKSGWQEDALLSLDESTQAVVERLSDPMQPQAYQSKGLVVGYVQSGKTANFTGVVARAADAGYRLIIILTGTTEILRRQTQRRLDREMIGREFLDGDYGDDRDLDSFVSHGSLPSRLGAYDWQRLTGPEYDYRSLKRGIDALDFAKVDKAKPVYDAVNLSGAKARLIVIKKNAAILKTVIKDLKRIQSRLEEIPSLIIDDESDQASLNTVNPEKTSNRSTINGLIMSLMKTLPRSQYVGYTATPFANVFVDPDDSEDLFPKDFILSLPRPPKYMGVANFYDPDAVADEDPRPNRDAFVRGVVGDDYLNENNLKRALDSFVLTGAIKLFRARNGVPLRSTHHTMLVHLSSMQADHREQARVIRELFRKTDYRSGDGHSRMKILYANDFLPVSKCRAPDVVAPTFAQLGPFIAEALGLINQSGDPVAVINSDKDSSPLDFDREKIWRIVVGGTKLSRGYTVEGLTISYYRRRARTADTLMQMGRWFGYREGYGDLVRLFIGVNEPLNKSGATINLYEAFGAICRDEEMFRKELQRYASLEAPRILPKQVPPLVASHMLQPTARNKMYNAIITHQNFAEAWTEVTMAPTEPKKIADNWTRFDELLGGAAFTAFDVAFSAKGQTFNYGVAWARVSVSRMIAFLKSYEWLGENPNRLSREIEFLNGAGVLSPGIDNWLILAPQKSAATLSHPINRTEFTKFSRSRVSDTSRFKAYSESRHRMLVEYCTLGRLKDPDAGSLELITKNIDDLRNSRQGVMLFYTVQQKSDREIVQPGFALFYPHNDIKTPITFGVRDPSRASEIVIPR